MSTQNSEIVADPVSHISISGVHGRDELNARLARAPRYHNGNGNVSALDPLLAGMAGMAIGAIVMSLLRR
jgi:hypothetical protein